MASTTAHQPNQPTFTRSTLLPLILLALATIAAFATAISSEWTNLSSLWTPCSINTTPVPAPLCFALNFFRAAHASPISRLEQATIVAFLAALATITASEAAAAARREHDDAPEVKRDRKGELVQQPPKGAAPPPSLASSIIDNLAVPWLLYNVALGALAWQGIIIPAFLHESARRTPQPDNDIRPQQHSLAIPLSITLGLFLPASAMLLSPQNPLPIIAFLLFPLWISLAQRLLPRITTTNKAALYAPALLASTLAHAALLLTLTTTSASTTPPRTRSAMLLLELDHAAIFLAVLHWLHRETGGAHRSVARVVAVSLVLGPGAGLCVGWMYRDSDRVADDVKVSSRPQVRRRASSGKATRCFFGY